MASRSPLLLPVTSMKFFAARSKRAHQGPVTAIEVDGATLRVVSASGRATITRVATERLELPADVSRLTPETLGKAIAVALDRLRLKPGAVVMGVPRASVLLRTLSLPGLENVDDLAAMVHLQIGKDLPFRADEAVIDFRVRPVSAAVPPLVETAKGAAGDGAPADAVLAPPKVEVLVAIVKRDVVDYYTKTATAAGLKLVALGLLSYANARCLDACRVVEDGKGVVLITLRPDEVGIDVVAQQSLLFSRGASLKPHGGPPPLPQDEAEETTAPASAPAKSSGFVEAVTIEVVRSLHGYGGMQSHNPVTKVVVAGTTGQEQAVVDSLRTRMSTPCSVLDVVQPLDLDPAAREPAAGSISAIGLALGASEEAGLPFDFLNPKLPAVPRDLKRILILLGAAAAVAVFVFVMGLRQYLINQRLRVKANVAAELADAKKKRPLYRQMRQQITTIDGWSQGGKNWLDHYAYLTAVLPPSEEVYITSFSISGAGAIHLSVQARSGQVLAKLDKQLRDAGYEVKPLAINPGTDRHGYDFRSTVDLEVPAKMKLDLTKVKPPPRPADDGSLDAVKGGGAR